MKPTQKPTQLKNLFAIACATWSFEMGTTEWE